MPAYAVFLNDLQQPVTQDMLRDAGGILKLRQSLKRGTPATGTIEVKSPGLKILQQSSYLALLETPTGRLEDAAFLGRARVGKLPKFQGQHATIGLTFAPASHKQDLRNAAQEATSGAAIPGLTVKVIPAPGVGSIAVAFSGAAGAAWSVLRTRAVPVAGVIQQDLVRTPYAKISWRVLTVANARLVLTIPAAHAAQAYLAAQKKLFAHIGVSGDKDPSHAVEFTQGKVMSASPGLNGSVDVEVNLADPDLVISGVSPAPAGDPTAAALPWWDATFGYDPNDPSTAAIVGRRSFWHTDPVTHAITLEDTIVGRRVVDLGGGGDETSFEITFDETPARRIRARVVADWTQRAVGGVDLAPVIATAAVQAGGSPAVQSMAEKVAEPQGDPKLEFRMWNGFSRGKTSVRASLSRTPQMPTGRTIAVEYRYDTLYPVSKDPLTGEVRQPYQQQGQPFTVVHSEYCAVNVFRTQYNAFWVTYDYSQQRREVVDLILDVDVQDTLLGTEEVDLGTFTLGDLLGVPGADPFQPGTVYHKGDRVIVGGRVYECLRDGTQFFWRVTWTVLSGGRMRLNQDPVDWLDLGTLAPLRDYRSPTFFDTARGRGALSHALMRMRRVAYARLQAPTLSKVYPWSVARDVDLRDEVTMTIRDGDVRKVVQGKVTAVERMLGGNEPAKVKVTIQPCLGTGRDDVAPAHAASQYVQAGYVDPTYTKVNTPAYLAPSVVSDTSGIYSTGDDVEWALTLDPLVLPIDAYRLSDPFYSCLECFVRNSVGLQIGEFFARMVAGRDPRGVPRDMPTTLDIAMRPMFQTGVLQRSGRVHAQLTKSPKGLDLQAAGF